MAEPRTKSGRVVKPSWRLQQNDSYAYPADLEPSPARSTSSLPGRSTASTEGRPPPLKRKRTSLGPSKPPTASPFDSSTDLTPVVSATSSSTSVLDVAQRPAGHQPAFLAAPAPAASSSSSSRPRQAAAPARSAPLPPPPPPKQPAVRLPRPRPQPAPVRRGPTIRSFVDFNDGSEELGLVITSGEFTWDGETVGGEWRATKNIKPGPSAKYRVTMRVQKLPAGPGRSLSKGIRRISTASSQKLTASARRVPTPQEILARPAANAKGKRRAASPSSGLDTDIGEGHTEDGIGSTDDEYDAQIERQAVSSSSSSSAPEEDPSEDDDFASEPEEDEEDAFAASRRKGKRRKAATTTTKRKSPAKKRKTRAPERACSPSYYGHGDSDANLIDDGRPRDRFGMPFPLEDDAYDEDDHERHPPFSGGLNLGQFENPLPPDEQQYAPEHQYSEQPTEAEVDMPPAPPSDDGDEHAMLELLAKVVRHGEMAASAIEAVEAISVVPAAEAEQSAEPIDLAPTPSEVVALVTTEDEPQENKVLAAILAAEQLTADASSNVPPSQPIDDAQVASDADAEPASEEELLIMGPADTLLDETRVGTIVGAVDVRPQETSVAVS